MVWGFASEGRRLGSATGADLPSCPSENVQSDTRPASRHLDVVTEQTTVRLPDELADDVEAMARVQAISVNALILDALTA